MTKFTAKGYISTKNGNSVDVEGVAYWISGQDVLRVAQAQGVKTEGLKASEYGIDGTVVQVEVRRDNTGFWAQLVNQSNYPVVA